MYHPDLKKNRDAPESHLRMIQLNEAYKRIVKAMRSAHGGNSTLPESGLPRESARESTSIFDSTVIEVNDRPLDEESRRDKSQDPKGIVPHKDPAYTYYKRGYKIFTRIHPGIWYWAWDRTSPTAMAAKVQEVIDLLPLAYYYFNVVVEEYPKSHWFLDSKYKIRKLERLAPIYKKILRSYRYRCGKKAEPDNIR